METPRGLVMRVDDSWTNDFAVLMQQITLFVPPGDAFFFYPLYSPMLLLDRTTPRGPPT